MAEWVTPIVDRTEADTFEAFNNQMIEERLKGALNFSDLNRIENNFKYLVDNLAKQGYYINHKYRNYTEHEAVVTKVEKPGGGGTTSTIVEPWIESSGTQYIDTGFKPSYATRVVARFYINSASGFLYGIRDTASSTSPRQFGAMFVSNTNMRVDYFGSSTQVSASSVVGNLLIDHNRNVMNANNGVSTNGAVSSGQCTYPLVIFGINNAGTPSGGASAKLYSFKIYDNDVLVRDFIPTLDDNGVACLYDKVEGKHYYNAGSGSFTYGENVYTPVQYIENTGEQYINTGITYESANEYVFETYAKCTTPSLSDWGLSGWNGGGGFGCSSGKWYIGASSTSMTADAMTKVKLTIQSGTSTNSILEVERDGITSSVTRTHPNLSKYTAMAYTIFAYPSDATTIAGYCTMQITDYFKIYVNGVLVRDFIPVIDASGVALLYDQLNGVPYFNAGTGSFVAGAIVPPTPPTDPTYEYIVEYVQNTYTEWFEQNIPWKSEIDRIRRNFNNLLKEYLYGKRISQVPYTQYFKFTEANKLEDISASTKQTLENMIAECRYCGTVNSGGDRLL